VSFGRSGKGNDHVLGCIGSVRREHDTEQVPSLEEGGIEAFLRREVLPYAPDS
jgi:hypothetical protein